MTIETAARAMALLDTIDRKLAKWECWFPNPESEVEVPRAALLALAEYARGMVAERDALRIALAPFAEAADRIAADCAKSGWPPTDPLEGGEDDPGPWGPSVNDHLRAKSAVAGVPA